MEDRSYLFGSYVFYLRCCFNPECIHPVCQSCESVNDIWYPSGPSLDFFPTPTPDPEHPFGNLSCKDCDGFCAGHYLKPDKLVSSVNIPSETTPPSQVLLKVFKESNGFPSEDVIATTASNVLLKPEEVRMWFKHLKVVQNNRKAGAKKAAATRKRKYQRGKVDDTASKQPLRDSDGDELCNSCSAFNPPELQDNDDGGFGWIACSNCSFWYHQICAGLPRIPIFWSCDSCKST